MADREWFIQQQSGHLGPFSADEIYRYFHEGRVRPESLMWKEGLKDWLPLKNCQEIAHALDFNLQSERLPRPLPPDALDLLKNDAELKKKHSRPVLHQVAELPPLPEAPSKSKGRNTLSCGEWDRIAQNFTPNPALEKFRTEAIDPNMACESSPNALVENHKDKEWEEFSGPLFPSPSDQDKLSLWDQKKSTLQASNTAPMEAAPLATPSKQRVGWGVSLVIVAIAVIAFIKVSGTGTETPVREVQILKQDFAKLNQSKSARFDKVFTHAMIDRPKFNLAMAGDGTTIWLGISARAAYRFEIDFKSVPNRIMGGIPIHFSTVGKTHEGLAALLVRDLSFQQGKKVEAGLYEVTLRASRADGLAKWLQVLGENTYSKIIINSFSSWLEPLEITLGPEMILLASGDEKEAAVQIENYFAQMKESKRRPLLEQQQNVLTIQSLLLKLGELMNTYRHQGYAGKAAYIRSYAKEIAPALQVLAVPTPPKIQVVDASAGDPDLIVSGPSIWSALDSAEMAKKLALLSVQFVDSLNIKKQRAQNLPTSEKILDDLSMELTTKVTSIEQELSALK